MLVYFIMINFVPIELWFSWTVAKLLITITSYNKARHISSLDICPISGEHYVPKQPTTEALARML